MGGGRAHRPAGPRRMASVAPLVSPFFVALLLTRVSGIPLLEARAEKAWGETMGTGPTWNGARAAAAQAGAKVTERSEAVRRRALSITAVVVAGSRRELCSSCRLSSCWRSRSQT